MSEQSLELIKTRTLFLAEGIWSGDVVLVDNIGGNMYFNLQIRYVSEDSAARTKFDIVDSFHAKMVFETKPKSLAKFDEPIEIGTYQERRLFLDIRTASMSVSTQTKQKQ